MYACKTWIDESNQTVSIAHDVKTNKYRLTILSKSADIVWNKWYYSRESVMKAMYRLSKNRREVVFASDLLKLSRAKLAKKYRAEIDWLQDLTAYEWKPGLVSVDKDDAWVMVDEWKKAGIDDIPRGFVIAHGYELLMVLWNEFIV